jgi:hypothetical protein
VDIDTTTDISEVPNFNNLNNYIKFPILTIKIIILIVNLTPKGLHREFISTLMEEDLVCGNFLLVLKVDQS